MELKSKIRIRFILFRALVILLTVAVAGLAAGLIGYILKKGLPYVSWEFLTTEPDILMDTYGIKPMIINTIYTVVLTLLFCIPLGIGSAIYLAEYAKQGKIVSAIRFAIEILAGIPSIVYGLFGLDFFVRKMSIGDYAGSMLAASLTLTLIVLPTMIRTTEESLLAVSSSYREAAAGTGAETTIAAVVTGSDHHKHAISDLCLIPRYAILDPALTVGLPPHITAETGMDALTHAVEAYLSRFYNTKQTRLLAENVVVTIFTHLERAYRDGTSLPDRAAMLQASFDAGAAFTRASVGNVHAIAHTLGGLYGVPHGLANAVLLPLVLEDYGKAAYPRLARLAALVGLKGESEESLAKAFIAEIRAMNARMDIPDHFNCIRKEDIPLMATWAAQEANPVYPVPVIYDEARFARVIERSHHSQ